MNLQRSIRAKFTSLSSVDPTISFYLGRVRKVFQSVSSVDICEVECKRDIFLFADSPMRATPLRDFIAARFVANISCGNAIKVSPDF